ncbi:histidine kinase [Tolypothrix sp. VBCCA 56010]
MGNGDKETRRQGDKETRRNYQCPLPYAPCERAHCPMPHAHY